MKSYSLTIPAFTRTMIADNRKDALELFLIEYDIALQDPDSRKPIIENLTKSA